MPEPLDQIFKDYKSSESTVAARPANAGGKPIEVETEKYGVGKPKRVEIRAKIIRDEDRAG
jgi:hypothetical protein